MIKRVIVTGASSGIGQAAAVLLAQSGCEVILSARRRELLDQIVDEVVQSGGSAISVPGDVAEPGYLQALVEAARARGEAYPVLVNSVGFAEFGDFAQMPLEMVRQQIELNYSAPVAACHAALPWMLEAGGGQVINVLSVAAVNVFPGAAAYGSSKAALHMFTKILAAEYRQKGIRVTSLIPGATDTPIWEGKSFVPERSDMLPVSAVAEAIRDLVLMPLDRNVDELCIMPPKGIL
jgi:short-subunit dehydrogenase